MNHVVFHYVNWSHTATRSEGNLVGQGVIQKIKPIFILSLTSSHDVLDI